MIIKPKSSRTKGIIASSFMVFALIAQPMYGLVASQVAEAAAGDPVCVDGGDCYTSVQTAINNAPGGGTVTVSAGTYSETVTIDKPLTLRGAKSGNDARNRTVNDGSESIINGGSQSALVIKSNNVTVDGFQIQQTGNGPHTVTTTANFSDIKLENNIVTSTTNSGSAMHLYGGQNFTIQKNYFTIITLCNGTDFDYAIHV